MDVALWGAPTAIQKYIRIFKGDGELEVVLLFFCIVSCLDGEAIKSRARSRLRIIRVLPTTWVELAVWTDPPKQPDCGWVPHHEEGGKGSRVVVPMEG